MISNKSAVLETALVVLACGIRACSREGRTPISEKKDVLLQLNSPQFTQVSYKVRYYPFSPPYPDNCTNSSGACLPDVIIVAPREIIYSQFKQAVLSGSNQVKNFFNDVNWQSSGLFDDVDSIFITGLKSGELTFLKLSESIEANGVDIYFCTPSYLNSFTESDSSKIYFVSTFSNMP